MLKDRSADVFGRPCTSQFNELLSQYADVLRFIKFASASPLQILGKLALITAAATTLSLSINSRKETERKKRKEKIEKNKQRKKETFPKAEFESEHAIVF